MILENVMLSLTSLKANKMRALLTMLGIIIGIASVIAIVTIGNALTASVSNNLSSLGTNNITVRVQEKSRMSTQMFGGGNMMIMGGGGGIGAGPVAVGGQRVNRNTQSQPEDSDMLSTDMLDEFKNVYPNEIAAISLEYSGGSAEAKDGDLYANININGVNDGYFIANSLEILDGRVISENDVDKMRNVAVVSDKLVNNMFKNDSDVIGQQIKVFKSNTIEIYTIIGIYKYEASAFSMGGSTASEENLTTNFYIPVSTAKQDLLSKNYQSVTVVTNSDTNVIDFTEDIKSYFSDVYKNNPTWSVNATNSESMLETITSTLDSIALAIAFIAGISLLVGGIGVMNIMLVSVTERTREIGTRKALGAKNLHIQFQFVIEAIIISGIGGIIGVALGSIIGAVISNILGAPITISLFVILASVIFSMFIGIFFGFYPANKAAKLDPIDALRYE